MEALNPPRNLNLHEVLFWLCPSTNRKSTAGCYYRIRTQRSSQTNAFDHLDHPTAL